MHSCRFVLIDCLSCDFACQQFSALHVVSGAHVPWMCPVAVGRGLRLRLDLLDASYWCAHDRPPADAPAQPVSRLGLSHMYKLDNKSYGSPRETFRIGAYDDITEPRKEKRMTPLHGPLPTVLQWTIRIVTTSLVVGMLAVPAAAHAAGSKPSATTAPSSSAPFAYIQNYNSGKCVEVPGYSTTPGTHLDQWSCIGQTNELWRPYLNSSGDYVFWNEANRQCIEVGGYSTANGAWIAQWPCTPSSAAANEIFYPYLFIGNINGKSYYEWANIYTNKCLNVSGASGSNGAKIIQWDCIPTAKNEWFAQPYAS